MKTRMSQRFCIASPVHWSKTSQNLYEKFRVQSRLLLSSFLLEGAIKYPIIHSLVLHGSIPRRIEAVIKETVTLLLPRYTLWNSHNGHLAGREHQISVVIGVTWMLPLTKMNFIWLFWNHSLTVIKSVLPRHFISDRSYDIPTIVHYFTQQGHDLKYQDSDLRHLK